jgi:hypothetical protein
MVTGLTERARADIARPGDQVAGQSQLFWAQAWWQWALGIGAPNNPLLDTTGAYAGVNNNGPVFFVAGVLGGGAVTRTFTVPFGKPLFLPVLNGFYVPLGSNGNFDTDPCPSPLTFSCAIEQSTAQITPLQSMSLTIDGVTLNQTQLTSFRQTSVNYFRIFLPDDNVFGLCVPPIKGCPPINRPAQMDWVQDGYYVTLTNLSPGTHQLTFRAVWGAGGNLKNPAFHLTVTDNITIVP